MSRPTGVAAVVLAAGGGTRMKSRVPKVLHLAAGRPLLAHVLAATHPLDLAAAYAVVPKNKAIFESVLGEEQRDGSLELVVQDPPQGTADAVKTALDALAGDHRTILVLQGDSPLIRTETLDALLHVHAESSAAATILTARVDDPTGYGRVVLSADGQVERIVEERDASYEEKAIDDINAGTYVFDVAALREALEDVNRSNAQNEYYLTDVVPALRSKGLVVSAYRAQAQEVLGVNSRTQLAAVTQILRRRTCELWMEEGVTIVDPDATYIDSTVTIARDAVVQPFTFLEGTTSIAEGAEVGPQARIVDSDIGEQATVSFAVVRESSIGPEASVGPFASLRPGTRLERGARLGTFVESKKTTIGEDSKANHLAYLGDAQIGRGVNVGAGTITCNWDGRDKHPTVIDDEAYIGSDTMLVAPTHIGKRAATGAGSVVRGDVPDEALAVGVPARIIEGKGNKMAPKGDTEPEEPRQ